MRGCRRRCDTRAPSPRARALHRGRRPQAAGPCKGPTRDRGGPVHRGLGPTARSAREVLHVETPQVDHGVEVGDIQQVRDPDGHGFVTLDLAVQEGTAPDVGAETLLAALIRPHPELAEVSLREAEGKQGRLDLATEVLERFGLQHD